MAHIYVLKHNKFGHFGYAPRLAQANTVIFGFQDRQCANKILQKIRYKDVHSQIKWSPPHDYILSQKPANNATFNAPINKKHFAIEIVDPFDLNIILIHTNMRLCIIDEINEAGDRIHFKGSLMTADGLYDNVIACNVLNNLFKYDKMNYYNLDLDAQDMDD